MNCQASRTANESAFGGNARKSGALDFGLPEGCDRFDALYAILQK
jgi:hypothetical protein